MKIVGVRFNKNTGDLRCNGFVPEADLAEKVYYFRSYEDYFVGDIVVVDTAIGFKIGVVWFVDVHNPTVQPVREVVCRVNVIEWENRKHARERRDAIKKQMDAKIAQVKELLLYEQMAAHDPELAEMLAEFKSFGGEL